MSDDFRQIPRLATDAERRHLKAITQQALHSIGGGDAFEASTRVKQGALSKYGSNSFPDHFIPVDVALELDRLAGAPNVIGAAARMLGYRLVPVDAAADNTFDLVDAQSVAKETGDVVNLLLALLSSGKNPDAADRKAVIKEVMEAKDSLYRVAMKIAGGAA